MCPNISVEFTCIATEVTFLNWFRNENEIEDYNSQASPGRNLIPPYTLFLDRVSVFPGRAEANFSSRLVANLSDLRSGDIISCSRLTLQDSNHLSYTIRGI